MLAVMRLLLAFRIPKRPIMRSGDRRTGPPCRPNDILRLTRRSWRSRWVKLSHHGRKCPSQVVLVGLMATPRIWQLETDVTMYIYTGYIFGRQGSTEDASWCNAHLQNLTWQWGFTSKFTSFWLPGQIDTGREQSFKHVNIGTSTVPED